MMKIICYGSLAVGGGLVGYSGRVHKTVDRLNQSNVQEHRISKYLINARYMRSMTFIIT